MNSLIFISWTGPNVKLKENASVQAAAMKYLYEETKARSVFFASGDCEGVLTRLREGTYGSFGGTFFTADLGEYKKGKRRIIHFLIRRGAHEWFDKSASTVRFQRFVTSKSGHVRETEHNLKRPRYSDIKIESPN